MAKLLSFPPRTKLIRIALVSIPFVSSTEGAGLSFDKLTACGDLSSLTAELREGSMPSPSECRAPSGPLEKSLVYRTGGKDSEVCLLSNSPRPSLDGFTCVRSPTEPGGTITCFRPAKLKDIELYQTNFRNEGPTAQRVAAYLMDASKCKASNGNATEGQATLMPIVLATIARMDFGFVMRMGTGHMPDSYVLHGYGKTDPEIRGETDAIEFVSILAGGRRVIPKAGATTKIGAWLLGVGDPEKTTEAQKKHLNIPGIATESWVRSYSFERQEGAKGPAISKDSFLNKIQGKVAKVLVQSEEFTELTDEQFKKSTGLSAKEATERSAYAVPYGFRGLTANLLYGRIRLFLNERRPACASNGSGAVGVGFMPVRGIPDVEPDYGSTNVFVIGMGSCADLDRSSTRQYLTGIDDLIQETIASEIKRW